MTLALGGAGVPMIPVAPPTPPAPMPTSAPTVPTPAPTVRPASIMSVSLMTRHVQYMTPTLRT